MKHRTESPTALHGVRVCPSFSQLKCVLLCPSPDSTALLRDRTLHTLPHAWQNRSHRAPGNWLPLITTFTVVVCHRRPCILHLTAPSLRPYPETHLPTALLEALDDLQKPILATRPVNPGGNLLVSGGKHQASMKIPSIPMTAHSLRYWCSRGELLKKSKATIERAVQPMYGPWPANLLGASCKSYSPFNIYSVFYVQL